MPYPKGRYRVTQPALTVNTAVQSGMSPFVRYFDSEEWSYFWTERGGFPCLRLQHDHDPEATDVYDYAEFIAPVNIEFTAEE